MSTTPLHKKGPQPEVIREPGSYEGLALSKTEQPVTVIAKQAADAPGTSLGQRMPLTRMVMVDTKKIDRTDYAVPILPATHGLRLTTESALVLLPLR